MRRTWSWLDGRDERGRGTSGPVWSRRCSPESSHRRTGRGSGQFSWRFGGVRVRRRGSPMDECGENRTGWGGCSNVHDWRKIAERERIGKEGGRESAGNDRKRTVGKTTGEGRTARKPRLGGNGGREDQREGDGRKRERPEGLTGTERTARMGPTCPTPSFQVETCGAVRAGAVGGRNGSGSPPLHGRPEPN